MNGPRVFAKTARMTAGHPKTATDGPDYPEAGRTANFILFYQRTLGPKGKAIADTLAANCEADFKQLKQWFGVTPANLPFKVYVTKAVEGAMHYGCADTEMYVGVIASAPPTSGTYSLFLSAEVVEVLEATIGHDWNCGYSHGEALSRVLPADIRPGALLRSMVTADIWLDKTPTPRPYRENWIDKTDPEDTNKFSVGCSVLFLNWLHFKLKRSWQDIIGAGAPTLAGVYSNLVKKDDGWTKFKSFIDAQYKPGKPSGVTTDNPFR